MSTLCTKDQVKSAVGITGTADDARIDSLIIAVTQAIMRRYEREFVPQVSAAARTFRADNRVVDLVPYDLRAATSVVLNPQDTSPTTLTANTDYALLPIGGAEKTATYLQLQLSDYLDYDSDFYKRFGFAQIQITGDWGIWVDSATVAEDVNRAAIETVLSWLDRPAAQVAGLGDLGEPHRALAATAVGWDIPFSAHRKLSLYSRSLGVF